MQFKCPGSPLPVRQFFYGSAQYRRAFVTMGAGTYIHGVDLLFNGANSHLLVGNYCSISSGLRFMIGMNHDHHCVTSYPFRCPPHLRLLGVDENILKDVPYPLPAPNKYQIIIGSDVWMGMGVNVFGGVRIGNGAVVGTNAVVTKDVPPYAIAVGNPARVVKYRFDDEIIRKLLAIKWWNWSKEKIMENVRLLEYPKQFVERFYSPELDRFEEDDLGRQLNSIGTQGKRYAFVADFRAHDPRWKRVIRGYLNAYALDDSLSLIVWTGLDSTPNDVKTLIDYANSLGLVKKPPKLLIVMSTKDRPFSPYALRQSDYFITTREHICSEAIDYLEGTRTKIISSLDESIFPGEREYIPIWG